MRRGTAFRSTSGPMLSTAPPTARSSSPEKGKRGVARSSLRDWRLWGWHTQQFTQQFIDISEYQNNEAQLLTTSKMNARVTYGHVKVQSDRVTWGIIYIFLLNVFILHPHNVTLYIIYLNHNGMSLLSCAFVEASQDLQHKRPGGMITVGQPFLHGAWKQQQEVYIHCYNSIHQTL